MIVNIELTQSGIDKFNSFFAANAKDGVSMQTVMLEALSVFEDRLDMGESLVYELGKLYTVSGNPATLTLAEGDYTVTEEEDE